MSNVASSSKTCAVLGTLFVIFFLEPHVAGPLKAATRYGLTYSQTLGAGQSLSGYIEIDTTAAAAQPVVGGIFPSWFKSLSLTYNNGVSSQEYVKSDFNALYWFPNNPGSIDWKKDLVPQFADINFGNFDDPQLSPLTRVNLFTIGDANPDNIFTLNSASSAPSPLPIFGAATAFASARRLRKRVRTTAHVN